jgi:hypothetical protein
VIHPLRTTLFSLAILGLAGCAGPILNAGLTPPTDNALASRAGFRWVGSETRNFRVRAEKGSDVEARLASIEPALESALRRVAAELQLSESSEPITVFLVASRERMRLLLGAPVDGRAFHSTRVMALSTSGDWEAVARHEIAHIVVGREWGAQKERWIGEGTATLVGDHFFGRSPHVVARERLLSLGRVVPLASLARDFGSHLDDVSYLQSASLALHLRQRYGLTGLRTVWQGGLAAIPAATGLALEEFEAEWLAVVRRASERVVAEGASGSPPVTPYFAAPPRSR